MTVKEDKLEIIELKKRVAELEKRLTIIEDQLSPLKGHRVNSFKLSLLCL